MHCGLLQLSQPSLLLTLFLSLSLSLPPSHSTSLEILLTDNATDSRTWPDHDGTWCATCSDLYFKWRLVPLADSNVSWLNCKIWASSYDTFGNHLGDESDSESKTTWTQLVAVLLIYLMYYLETCRAIATRILIPRIQWELRGIYVSMKSYPNLLPNIYQ